MSSTAANEMVCTPIGLFSRFIEFNSVAKTGKAEKPKPDAAKRERERERESNGGGEREVLVVLGSPTKRMKAVLLVAMPSFIW